MRDCREEWFDAGKKVAVTIDDATLAAMGRGYTVDAAELA